MVFYLHTIPLEMHTATFPSSLDDLVRILGLSSQTELKLAPDGLNPI